jgi:hypothetical protein
MKRTLLILALLSSTTAFAHGHWAYHGGGWGWVAPAVVGGVVGYELARPPVYAPAPVVVGQPVIVQQPVVTQQQNCSPWTQIQNPDGSITTTRTCQ